MKGPEIQVVRTVAKNVDLRRVKPGRAGVILFYREKGLFGFGVDARYREITDFAGGVVYGKDYNVIRGALREFKEETLGLFGELSEYKVRNCPVLYDGNNLVIFLETLIPPVDISKEFLEAYKCALADCDPKNKPEVCGIRWFSWEEMQKEIRGFFMFGRLRNFLYKAGDFAAML